MTVPATLTDLEAHIKQVLIQRLQLPMTPEEIADDVPLFGRGSQLELDSVEVLEVLVALKQQFSLTLGADFKPAEFNTVRQIAQLVLSQRAV